MSLTYLPNKLVELIIKNRLIKHLDHDRKGSNLHSFCTGKSCLSNLLQFFDCLNKKTMNKGELVDIIYLDFQKAFKVPNERLKAFL